MNLAEALKAVEDGKRITSPAISQGWVVKLAEGEVRLGAARYRVVNERTGSSFDFMPSGEYHRDDWRIVEGWANYAT